MHERPVLYLEEHPPARRATSSRITWRPASSALDQVLVPTNPAKSGADNHRSRLTNGCATTMTPSPPAPSRTIAGLRSFHQVVPDCRRLRQAFPLMCLPDVEHVKALVLTGDTAPSCARRWSGHPAIRRPCPLWNTRILRRRAGRLRAGRGRCSCRPLAPPSTASRILRSGAQLLRGLSTA